jgi:hypothetical protein
MHEKQHTHVNLTRCAGSALRAGRARWARSAGRAVCTRAASRACHGSEALIERCKELVWTEQKKKTSRGSKLGQHSTHLRDPACRQHRWDQQRQPGRWHPRCQSGQRGREHRRGRYYLGYLQSQQDQPGRQRLRCQLGRRPPWDPADRCFPGRPQHRSGLRMVSVCVCVCVCVCVRVVRGKSESTMLPRMQISRCNVARTVGKRQTSGPVD